MAAPRTKRQFAGAASDPAQRQITSFFERKTSSSDSSPPSDYASGPLSPQLPGQVQANLLSVGMRVRKSVPEGYKTGHKFGGFSLWADSTSPPTESPSSVGSFQRPASSRPEAYTISSPRELLPFCGINKVGGLAVQPETAPIPATFFTGGPAISISPSPELDDVPGLTSSQDSVSSTMSEAPFRQPYTQSSSSLNKTPNSKKRLYADDTTTAAAAALSLPVPEAGNPIIWRQRSDWVDGQVSPRSLAPVGWEKNARVMAVPRGVRKAGKDAGEDGAVRLRDLDQENRVAVAGDADDFEEAEFLDYMEVEDE